MALREDWDTMCVRSCVRACERASAARTVVGNFGQLKLNLPLPDALKRRYRPDTCFDRPRRICLAPCPIENNNDKIELYCPREGRVEGYANIAFNPENLTSGDRTFLGLRSHILATMHNSESNVVPNRRPV
jgi:hypothetical protein